MGFIRCAVCSVFSVCSSQGGQLDLHTLRPKFHKALNNHNLIFMSGTALVSMPRPFSFSFSPCNGYNHTREGVLMPASSGTREIGRALHSGLKSLRLVQAGRENCVSFGPLFSGRRLAPFPRGRSGSLGLWQVHTLPTQQIYCTCVCARYYSRCWGHNRKPVYILIFMGVVVF